MKHQKGAALIVVLSLLTVSLMVGLSSMQSSMIDERLAGNYRALADAQMAAEKAASEGWVNIDEVKDDEWVSLSDLTDSGFDGLAWNDFYGDAESGGCQTPESCYYYYIKDGGSRYIAAMGAIGNADAVSDALVVEVYSLGPGMGNFGTTSVIGNIEDGALQFPSSSPSEVSDGEYVNSDGESVSVASFMLEEGLSTYDKASIISLGSKADLTEGNTGYFSNDIQSRLNLLKEMYDTHPGSSGADSKKPSCSGLCFYKDGFKFTGGGTLTGVHVVLNGDVQVGGNSDIQGVLIVLNLGDNGLNDEVWDKDKLGDVTLVKLNGGGNKGTVWFDSAVVKAALSSGGVTLDEFFGNADGAGGAGGWGIKSWQ
ncbi:pilus assembly PilX family protein [Halomonas sp. B23F22_10]|uniref:pilus assembly PilX family protein n=1 Tax=Halomonas sp. B23F22_10 TaxID=3459515 RepID=UPI00373F8DF4